MAMSRDIIARETRALSLASLGAPVNTLGKFAEFCFQVKFAMLSLVLVLPHTEPRDAADSAWVSEGTLSYSVSATSCLSCLSCLNNEHHQTAKQRFKQKLCFYGGGKYGLPLTF